MQLEAIIGIHQNDIDNEKNTKEIIALVTSIRDS